MHANWLPAIAALLVLTLFACDDDPATSESTTFNARVVNESGVPVAGAAFHYMFSTTSPAQLAKQTQVCPSTQINYTIPTATLVLVTVLRWHTRVVIDTLVNGQQNAGSYSIRLVDSLYTNGVYIYRITFDSTTIERYMVLLHTSVASLITTRPFAATEDSGRLQVPIAQFGFDLPFPLTSATGDSVGTGFISRTIEVVLAKPGYHTLIQTYTIGANSPPGPPFVLQSM